MNNIKIFVGLVFMVMAVQLRGMELKQQKNTDPYTLTQETVSGIREDIQKIARNQQDPNGLSAINYDAFVMPGMQKFFAAWPDTQVIQGFAHTTGKDNTESINTTILGMDAKHLAQYQNNFPVCSPKLLPLSNSMPNNLIEFITQTVDPKARKKQETVKQNLNRASWFSWIFSNVFKVAGLSGLASGLYYWLGASATRDTAASIFAVSGATALTSSFGFAIAAQRESVHQERCNKLDEKYKTLQADYGILLIKRHIEEQQAEKD